MSSQAPHVWHEDGSLQDELEAEMNGHLDCLRYGHENGCPWDEDGFDKIPGEIFDELIRGHRFYNEDGETEEGETEEDETEEGETEEGKTEEGKTEEGKTEENDSE